MPKIFSDRNAVALEQWTYAAPKSSFQGIDEALSAIILLEHGLTHPSKPPMPPALGFGWVTWVLVRKVSDGVEGDGLRPWGIK